MRIASLFSLIGGLLMLAASVALFVIGILAMDGGELLSEFEPVADQTFVSSDVQVPHEGWARLTLSGYISSESVQEETDGGGAYRTRYHFPFALEINDVSGARVVKRSGTLAWNSPRITRIVSHHADSRGGELELHQTLETFAAPPSGIVRIRLNLDGDQRYGARIRDLKLRLYKTATPLPGIFWAGAGLMLLLGPGLLILGIVLYGMSRARNESAAVEPVRTTTGDETGPSRDPIRSWAVMTHLSALLAYTGIPFGHVIGPLIIWMLKRDEFAELDAHGKESLNFQISISIYGIICLLLSLLLIGLLLFFILICVHIIFTIIAAIKANDGLVYRYPFCLRLIK